MPGSISVTLELSGGAELMFGNNRLHKLEIPADQTLQWFLLYLADEKMTDKRRDLFIQGDTVRPGMLVLINDADWELEGEGEYVVQDRDVLHLISSLHGG
ncbi:Ubiquitin-related modifier 1 [Saitoella coloradoensis]